MANAKKPAAAPLLATPKLSAVFINNANAQWGEGIVRLDLGDQTGEQPVEPRASVVMTAQQARLLAGILNQAADALLPASPAEESAEG